MKKLMVLAALSAMAMGARAAYTYTREWSVAGNEEGNAGYPYNKAYRQGGGNLIEAGYVYYVAGMYLEGQGITREELLEAIVSGGVDSQKGGLTYLNGLMGGEASAAARVGIGSSIEPSAAAGTVQTLATTGADGMFADQWFEWGTKKNQFFYVVAYDGEDDTFWLSTNPQGNIYDGSVKNNLWEYYKGEDGDVLNMTYGTWNSVPEPTSGLLLLLGVAGLALKRKRA